MLTRTDFHVIRRGDVVVDVDVVIIAGAVGVQEDILPPADGRDGLIHRDAALGREHHNTADLRAQAGDGGIHGGDGHRVRFGDEDAAAVIGCGNDTGRHVVHVRLNRGAGGADASRGLEGQAGEVRGRPDGAAGPRDGIRGIVTSGTAHGISGDQMHDRRGTGVPVRVGADVPGKDDIVRLRSISDLESPT